MPAMPISAHLAARQGFVPVRVEDDDSVSRQRHADGRRLVGTELGRGGGHSRLGRAVGVQDGAAGLCQRTIRWCGQASPETSRKRRSGQVLLDGGKQRRHAAQDGDLPLQQEIGEVVADQAGARLAGHQGGAGHQRHPQLLDREVECDGHVLVDAVARVEAIELGRHLDEVADARVLDDDPFGVAGRAGGVDDVGELVLGRRVFVVCQTRHRFFADLALGGVEKDLRNGEACRASGERPTSKRWPSPPHPSG